MMSTVKLIQIRDTISLDFFTGLCLGVADMFLSDVVPDVVKDRLSFRLVTISRSQPAIFLASMTTMTMWASVHSDTRTDGLLPFLLH